ncbi:hypothetical protein LJ737_02330 [Hymenobacter sp. 15J16-1T3B]|uniref:hypothetical protein n=1 Tax=Hymenobacter sp. 15J16-1T3B TaxID=2886941 RepID=UPI001D10223A|nr:hypothetical protein [Hymenobacter sp. 15J16-1T3B]MCC3156052.1 hypothetical protein [Hymenobacter sp. 15J16-1T3B]
MAAVLSLLPRLTQAQAVTDVARATQARDSVLLRANTYRQTIEQQAARFDVTVHRLGKRRRVVHGYYLKKSTNPNSLNAGVVSTKREKAWKHVTRTLATGVVRERYLGYLDGQKVLEETRTNHQTTFVRVSRVVRASGINLVMGRARQGLLTSEGYVQWGREQFLLTAPTKL